MTNLYTAKSDCLTNVFAARILRVRRRALVKQMIRVDYRCQICGTAYNGMKDDSGNFVGCEYEGQIITKCRYCNNALLSLGILEAKRATQNNPAKLQIAIVNTTKNLAASGNQDPKQTVSLGMFHLLKGGYEFAQNYFRKVIDELDPSNPDAYFYNALAILKGRKPFLLLRPEINQIEESLNMAEAFGDGDPDKLKVYYYFRAYIYLDYFKRKHQLTQVSYDHFLRKAVECGLTAEDRKDLFEILKQPRPDGL